MLTTYKGTMRLNDQDHPAIIAARSPYAAARKVGLDIVQFLEAWGVSGNSDEIQVASLFPDIPLALYSDGVLPITPVGHNAFLYNPDAIGDTRWQMK